MLLRHGIEVSQELPALALAGNLELVTLLLEGGADPNQRDYAQDPALHRAAEGDHGEVVKLLLGRGADIDAVAKHGETALHRAAAKGHGELVAWMLDRGASVDESGVDALGLAAMAVCPTAIEALLDAGVRPLETQGPTPLQSARDALAHARETGDEDRAESARRCVELLQRVDHA